MAQIQSTESVNHQAIALGLLAGLALGLLATVTGSDTLIRIATAFRPLGSVLVNAIRMVVIPLVMVVVFLAVGRLGDARKLGKLGGYALGLVWLSYVPAILLGAFGMKLGLRLFPVATLPVLQEAAAWELPTLLDFVIGLVPPTPFEAAANGSLLSVLVFTVLFRAATIPMAPEAKKGLFEVAETGWAMIQSLGVFLVTVIVCLTIQWLLTYLPAVKILGKMGPRFFHKSTLGTSAIGIGALSLTVFRVAVTVAPVPSAAVVTLAPAMGDPGREKRRAAKNRFRDIPPQIHVLFCHPGPALRKPAPGAFQPPSRE